MVTCIEIWKIFLVQRDAGTTNQKQFQPVLNVFGFEYNSMNFELEAEHMLTEIFTKMSFVVKKKKKMQILKLMKTLYKTFQRSQTSRNHGRKSWRKI